MATSAGYSASVKTSSKTFDLEAGSIDIPLEEYVLKVLPKDLLTVLRGVALQELNEQIAIGNNPTQVLVDGRPVARRAIVEATRSVSLRFTDTDMLLRAIIEIYNLLIRVTRIQSPPKNAIIARRHFHLWMNGKPVGLLPGALQSLKNVTFDDKTVLRVVGPLVNYGRKLYWRPIGRQRSMDFKSKTGNTGVTRYTYGSKYAPRFKPYSDRTIKRLANRAGPAATAKLLGFLKKRPGYVEGSGQIVKRIMRRNPLFASLYISDGWVEYPPSKSWGKHSKDARVPSVSVQMSNRGRVRVINI